MKYVKRLFTNIQKQVNMLKISLQTSRTNNSRILSIKNAKDFQSIVFIKTQRYREIFKSALVYL